MLVRGVVSEIGSRIGLGIGPGCDQGGIHRGIANLAALILEEEELSAAEARLRAATLEENHPVVGAENRIPTVSQNYGNFGERRTPHRRGKRKKKTNIAGPEFLKKISITHILLLYI